MTRTPKSVRAPTQSVSFLRSAVPHGSGDVDRAAAERLLARLVAQSILADRARREAGR
jgi:hypothetical protein